MPAAPGAYPVDAPVINDNTITVDELIQEPERITRDVAALSMQRFYADRIFTPSGGVTGGAILFERPNPLATDLYGEREPKEVAPGEEFPLQTFVRGVPMIARPRKIGNKWFTVKEAVKRNDPSRLRINILQTANTIRRRLENMALTELAAVVTAESRWTTGTSWSTYAGLTPDTRTGITGPVADVAAALALADTEERGVDYDSMIMHTNQALAIRQAFPGLTFAQVFGLSDDPETGQGIRNVYVTPRHAAGVVTIFEQGRVGQWRNEFPLEEETEWEGVASGGRQRWWYQWSISPMFFVDDPFAILEIRGVA